MAEQTKTVEILVEVKVSFDESKFTEEFMQEFSDVFYDFRSIEDHIKHIAQLEARGLLKEPFTEGYGNLKDMGISVVSEYFVEGILEHHND